MKIYTILLFSFLFLFTGNRAMAEEYNNIAISGTVNHPKSKNIRIVLYNYVPGESNVASSAELDGTNSFHFVSYIREPALGRVFYGKESFPVYLEPGYDLRLSFNSSGMQESLEFFGVGSRNNAFLAEMATKFALSTADFQEKAKNSGEEMFKAWAAAKRESQKKLLYSHKDELSAGFVMLQEAEIDYQWANELFAYARFQEEHSRKEKLSESFYDFMDEVKLHNYEVISLQSYRDFLENYLQHNYSLMKESLSEENSNYYKTMYQVARKSLRSLPMYHMQAVYLVNALNYMGVDAVKDEYIEFANECPNQAYKNVLHQMVKAQTITPKEPEIVFSDERGRSIPLKELRGSIVLVRFTNYLTDSVSRLIRRHDQELKERLSSYREVKFLELPMEDNREAFEKMIYADASEYLKSIMNRPKPGQEKPKVPPFSYILLNRDGLVVSNSLDDPKNELAVEKIDALLRQEKHNASVE